MTHPEFLRAFALAECTEVGDDDAARLLAAASRIEELERALIRLRDCDWVITPLDRMDAVREIARQALSEPSPDAPVKRIGAARYLEG